jgi:hypothetical protein
MFRIKPGRKLWVELQGIDIELGNETDEPCVLLPDVVPTHSTVRFVLCAGHSGYEKSRQNDNDRQDDQQFDECEGSASWTRCEGQTHWKTSWNAVDAARTGTGRP